MAEKKDDFVDSSFKILYNVNVNDFVEKKSNGVTQLTYLSWASAWAEVMKRYPNASYTIREWDDKPYLEDEKLGYMVMTTVTINEQSRTMWLPVMDGNNKAQKSVAYTYKTKSGDKTVQPATMFDINTAIMRCLTKNLGMFGLGLYIYKGEDIPESDQEAAKIALEEAFVAIANCKTNEDLENVKKQYSILANNKKFTEKVDFKDQEINGTSF